MDLLSTILSSLKADSTFISGWYLSEPWGVDVTDFEPGYCLTVMQGACWVEIPGLGQHELSVGDSILATRGGRCALYSSPQARRENLNHLPWRGEKFRGLDASTQPAAATQVSWGGGGCETRLLGLAFTFQQHSADLLLAALPEFIILKRGEAGMLPLTQQAMDFLMDDTHPGYFAVARQLADLTIISLLRAYILSSDEHPIGWLKGMRDRHISKALTAIHSEPGHGWTVAALAAQANLSRSAFSARFATLIGMSPIDYLQRWRIKLATEKLTSTQLPLAVIATQLGYQSDRVFRQVFRKYTGMSPQKFRAQLV